MDVRAGKGALAGINRKGCLPRTLGSILLCLLCGGLAAGQVFEVATLKLSGSAPSRIEVTGGPGTGSPNRYTCNHCPLMFLIRSAYNVDADRVQGPSWIETEQYDVMADVPPNTSKARFNRMMQSLLAERVALRAWKTTKQVAGYDLTAGAGAARLKHSNSAGDADVNAALRAPRIKDAEGFPVLPRGYDGPLFASVSEATRWIFYCRADFSMEKLAVFLGKTIKAPVRDRTGLPGKYEIRLNYEKSLSEIMVNGEPLAAPGSTAAGANDPQMTVSTLAASLDKRLGLKLAPGKVDVDMVVIDRVERKPTGN